MSTSVSPGKDLPSDGPLTAGSPGAAGPAPGGGSPVDGPVPGGGSPADGLAAAGANRLRVEELTVSFRLPGATVRAVTGVSFEVRPGRCLALVGESGCGKSVLAHALLGLLPGNAEVAGRARLEHAGGSLDLLGAPEAVLARRVRGRAVGLIPQSPATHLTPVRTARAQLEEALRELGHARPRERADELALRQGLHPADLDRYPHELSGGMAQRVANAMALAGDPWLILADEPTGGLDRPLVDRAMAALRGLCDEGRAVLLITHDLRAAERVADDLAVMYAGRLVETGPAGRVLDRPRHPYAAGLVNARPDRAFVPIPGMPPELTRLPDGCAFAPRCPSASGACAAPPPLAGGVACHHPLEDDRA
ncbi:ABC transporter ATP-binding protein [Planomonospora parontospora]|uniref:ABC transporter ATP-binding protein n=1 Tax=Planomonospora parontospora TaxID=58119 RepID=UPI0019AD8BE1|nr:ABC transporter ATP-binding protein [Planomonospora parontospora]GGL19427.1 ABC transporter ATP-binding protein [Planomonospora parontospora subsp. antibiotica]GII13735.1 ABC transporter ATP-binding protein [Planomonospora parontospora subsp. antibiotica]